MSVGSPTTLYRLQSGWTSIRDLRGVTKSFRPFNKFTGLGGKEVDMLPLLFRVEGPGTTINLLPVNVK